VLAQVLKRAKEDLGENAKGLPDAPPARGKLLRTLPKRLATVCHSTLSYPNCHPWPGKKWRRPDPICFFVKEGNDAIVLVSPDDRRIADAIH
jgi:hypothetical protein